MILNNKNKIYFDFFLKTHWQGEGGGTNIGLTTFELACPQKRSDKKFLPIIYVDIFMVILFILQMYPEISTNDYVV